MLTLTASGLRLADLDDGAIGLAIRMVDGPTREMAGPRHSGDRVAGKCGDVTASIAAVAAKGGIILTISLENGGARAVRLRSAQVSAGISALSAEADVSALRIAYCGAHSRSQLSRSGARRVDGDESVDGWWVSAVSQGSDAAGVVFGAVDFRLFATEFRMTRRQIEATIHLEGWELEPGGNVSLPALWLRSSRNTLEDLETYAGIVGERHGARPRDVPCGWGSWGHFFERIDAGLMRETLLAINGTESLRRSIRIIQIDDGWSELLESHRVSASWLPNRRFPSGIASLANEIINDGRDCGLWLIPFTANKGSALAEQHPEYLVKDEHGEPFRVAGMDSYCIDPTHPGAREWLRDLLLQIKGWGVRYVKLDHLRGLMSPDPDQPADNFAVARRYHDARTRVEAYRKGLELVREVLGPEVFIVGCSAPAGPSAGLVDAHRVGPDIHREWVGGMSGIRDVARSIAANFFWHGRTWLNDPDYLIAGRSVAESRFWASVVALSGGSQIISADFPAMEEWEERMLSLVTPPIGKTARPLDLFENGPDPTIWSMEFQKGSLAWKIIGLFNWDTQPREFSLTARHHGVAGPLHAWDVWEGCHQRHPGTIHRIVEARSARLLAIRQAFDHPQFVGSDGHFSQGAVELEDERWDPRAGTLTLRASETLPRAASASVWIPDNWKSSDAPIGSRLVTVPLVPGQEHTLYFESPTETRGRTA